MPTIPEEEDLERWRFSLLYSMGVRKILEIQSKLGKVMTEQHTLKTKLRQMKTPG